MAKKSAKKAGKKAGARALEKKPESAPNWQKNLAVLDKYFEIIAFVIYTTVLLIVMVPELVWDYDLTHDAPLMMSSVRIWEGQVPYRDFFPWYGPVYHYFLALVVKPLGNNLYAIKVFTDIANPILCMAILAASLRILKLPLFSRIYIWAATILWGLERIYYCGSLRSFLPILLLAVLHWGYQKRNILIYFLVFPAAWFLFFFSPEIGLFSVATIFIYLGLGAWLTGPGRERSNLLLWPGAGLLVSFLMLLVIYVGTVWFKNYLSFLSDLQKHFVWCYGTFKPDIWGVLEKPKFVFLYLPAFIHFFTLLVLAAFWRFKKINLSDWLWVPALVGFGFLYWASNIVRGGNLHLEFSFLPAVIVTGLIFAGSYKPVNISKIAAQLLAVALLFPGLGFFKLALQTVYKGKDSFPALGVRMPPSYKPDFEAVQKMEKAHGSEGIDYPYPYNSWVYAYLGRKPEVPFDTIYYTNLPVYQDKLLDSVKKMKGKYIVVIHRGMPWDFPGEGLDLLFDLIDKNYRVVSTEDAVWVYERRPEPMSNTRVVMTDPGPYQADRSNDYTFTFAKKDPNLSAAYVEFRFRFEYPIDFLKSFSMPIMECSFNGKWWRFSRTQEARQRLNPVTGSIPYRIYLYQKTQQLACKVTFPGAYNFKPTRITAEDGNWVGYIGPDLPSLKARPYFLQEPGKAYVEEPVNKTDKK